MFARAVLSENFSLQLQYSRFDEPIDIFAQGDQTITACVQSSQCLVNCAKLMTCSFQTLVDWFELSTINSTGSVFVIVLQTTKM